MRELNYPVPEQYNDTTVQTFLRRGCGVSSRLLAKLKRTENGMTIDGAVVRSIDRVKTGQEVVIRMPEDTIRVEAVDLPLSVVYEDEDVLVVDKPAGIAVHPSAGKETPTLAAVVIAHFQKSGQSCSFRPLNRLDRNTSGLLLAAKNPHAAHLLGDPADRLSAQKEYLAVVLGRLEGEGVIDQPIRVKEGSCITREVGEGGKDSLTRWRSLAADDELSLLRVVIETGRTHQIRVHMAWLGHPLAGDTMYGTDTRYLDRHALHCTSLGFRHPTGKQWLTFTAPPPSDMTKLIEARGWNFW